MDYLGEKEGERVIHLLTELFLYANEANHKKTRITKHNLQQLCLQGSELLFKDKETSRKLIQEYINAHPELSEEDKTLYQQWQGQEKRALFVMMYEREYTFVMDCEEQKVYGVKGLTAPLLAALSKQTFPCQVDYTILPYHHEYIVDAIGVSSPVKDLDVIIKLYEEFRSITMKQGAIVSDNSKPVQFRNPPRDQSASYETIISDYLKPLEYVIATLSDSFKKEGIELALAAWNASFEEEAAVAQRYRKDVYETMIHPLMEFRKNSFPDQTFKVKRLRPYQDSAGRNIMKVEVE